MDNESSANANMDWTPIPVQDEICKRLAMMESQLDQMAHDINEFKILAGKIWGFVEQMKDNPMLSAMLGGLPRK